MTVSKLKQKVHESFKSLSRFHNDQKEKNSSREKRMLIDLKHFMAETTKATTVEAAKATEATQALAETVKETSEQLDRITKATEERMGKLSHDLDDSNQRLVVVEDSQTVIKQDVQKLQNQHKTFDSVPKDVINFQNNTSKEVKALQIGLTETDDESPVNRKRKCDAK